jgi:hypothetical protein
MLPDEKKTSEDQDVDENINLIQFRNTELIIS